MLVDIIRDILSTSIKGGGYLNPLVYIRSPNPSAQVSKVAYTNSHRMQGFG